MSAFAASNPEAARRAEALDGEPVIRLQDVGKAYKVFGSKLDNFIDALGLDHLMPWRRTRHIEFWALRGINLALGKGQRIGIVGRNGAGKTTLLKLITRNLNPTTGTVTVRGKVQAMIDAGAGFHPDFTGRENIRASLTLQGFNQRRINESIQDIAEFTELGEFLERPFKTYSSGMMARLMFATATAIKPEILVIDEILGAGDAYFVGKSNERMRQLVDTGASILLVSHSMEQITLLCDKAIWLDRGRVVKSGSSLDVVTAYSQYIRVLEDRRQKARNQKVASRRRLTNDVMESYSDTVVLRFVCPPGTKLDVSHARLLRDGIVEEECSVGDAQDSDSTQPAFVVITSGGWSAPASSDGTLFRSIQGGPGSGSAGQVAFNLFTLYPTIRYSVEMEYRLSGAAADLEVSHAGVTADRFELPDGEPGFQRASFDLSSLTAPASRAAPDPVRSIPEAVEPTAENPAVVEMRAQTRWPGEGSLLIEKVELLGDDGREHGVYQAGSRMKLCMTIRAARGGSYPVIPVAVLYRSDGVKVFSHIGAAVDVDMAVNSTLRFALDLGNLNLGDGHFAFAIAIYRKLEGSEAVWYDLIDRDYRFELVGAPPFMGLFEHSGHWTLS